LTTDAQEATLNLFESTLQKPPKGNYKYVFVTDSGKLCEKIINAKTLGVVIKNAEGLEKFKEIVTKMITSGSYIRQYNISSAASTKKLNDEITELLEYWDLHTDRNAWKLFNNKKFCFNFYEENWEETEKTIKEYIAKQTPQTGKVNIKRFEEIEEKGVFWLWYPYIPRGKVTFLSGIQGTGKTFFTCWLAAQVSTGGSFGDGNPFEIEPENVLIFNAEDGIADTLKPRLKPLKPNFERIMSVEEWGDINFVPYSFGDIERLDEVFKLVKPGLVIFDPIQAYIGAGTDMHRANEVRPLMANLSALADRYNAAVLLVGHLNKSTSQSVFDRILGSVDFIAAVRSGLFLGQHPEEKQVKILFQVKSNLAERGENLAYKIQNGVFIPNYDLDVSDITPEQAAETKEKKKTEPTKKEIAQGLIADALKEKGWAYVRDLKKLAEDNGIAWKTFQRARPESVKTHSVGFNDKINWWSYEDISPS